MEQNPAKHTEFYSREWRLRALSLSPRGLYSHYGDTRRHVGVMEIVTVTSAGQSPGFSIFGFKEKILTFCFWS